jgi:phosphatidylglycerophosphate synthase
MSWPNRITVLRLMLVTPFVICLLYASDGWEYRYGAMALAILMGIGDAADGILARRMGMVTRAGSILDPLADHALMISALITLTVPGVLSAEDPSIHLPLWVSVTLVSRALFMLVGMAVLLHLSGFFQGLPSFGGKAAMVLQFAIVIVMCAAPDLVAANPGVAWPCLHVLWGVTVALGVISWLGYVRLGSKLLTAGGHS